MLKKFTNEKEQAIAKEYATGKNSIQLAHKYKCHRNTILVIIRRQKGIVRPKLKRHIFSEKQEKRIMKEYLYGKKSARTLSKKYSIDVSTVCEIVRRCGGEMRTISEALAGK